MRDVVDLVLLEELRVDDPGAVLDDLVDPAAVAHGLGALGARQHGQALAHVGFAVARDADEEVDVRERLLGLLELAHVATAEEKKETSVY